jgi:hypothetical protein
MTCERCPLSLLCLSGEIVLDHGYYCAKCGRFNLNLAGAKRQTFACRLVDRRATIYAKPHQGPHYCLHCSMSQVVFWDLDLGQRVLYERRTKGARLRLKDFATGVVIRRQE